MSIEFVLKRKWIAGSDMLMFVMISVIYTWSVFVLPLEAEFGWSRIETSVAYSICHFCICIGAFISAALARVLSRTKIVLIAAALIFIGFYGSAKAESLNELYFFFGIVCGIGVGWCYNSSLSTVVSWFPEKCGAITGALLMFFGLGSMILNPVAAVLIGQYGWRTAFLALGSVVAVIVAGTAFQARYYRASDGIIPEGILEKVENQRCCPSYKDIPPSQMIRRKDFWLYFVWRVCLVSVGLGISGHGVMVAAESGVKTSQTAFCTGLIAFCNGIGRLIFGVLFDYLGRRMTTLMVTGLGITGSVILFTALITIDPLLLYSAFILLGLTYGGAVVVGPNFIRIFYGSKNYPINMSLSNMVALFASFFGPSVAAIIYDASGYLLVSVFFIFITISSLIPCLLIKEPVSGM